MEEFATIIECNPLITLKDLNGQIRIQFPEKPNFSQQTLSNSLHDMLFIVNLIRDCPLDRNLDDVVSKRKLYVIVGECGNCQYTQNFY